MNHVGDSTKIGDYCPQCQVLSSRCSRLERDLERVGTALLRLSEEHEACPQRNMIDMLEALKTEKQSYREMIHNRDRYIMATEEELHQTYSKLKAKEKEQEAYKSEIRGLRDIVNQLEKQNQWLKQCTKKVHETHSRIAEVPTLVRARGLTGGDYLSPKGSSRSPSHPREGSTALPPRMKRSADIPAPDSIPNRFMHHETSSVAAPARYVQAETAAVSSRYVLPETGVTFPRSLRQGRRAAGGEDRTEAKRDPSQLPAGKRHYDTPSLGYGGTTRTMTTSGGGTAPDSARLPHSTEGYPRPMKLMGTDLAKKAVTRQVTRHSTPATGMKPISHENHTALKNGRLASAEPGQVENSRTHETQPPTKGVSERLVTQSAHKSLSRNRPPPLPTACVALTTHQGAAASPSPLTKSAAIPTPADVHDQLPAGACGVISYLRPTEAASCTIPVTASALGVSPPHVMMGVQSPVKFTRSFAAAWK